MLLLLVFNFDPLSHGRGLVLYISWSLARFSRYTGAGI